MRDKGIAHIGIGVGTGENKAIDAIKNAMESPLLETTVAGATDIIVNFSGEVGIMEVYEAVDYLGSVAGEDVNIIFGNVDGDVAEDAVSITIIATGLEGPAPAKKEEKAVEEVKAVTRKKVTKMVEVEVEEEDEEPAPTPAPARRMRSDKEIIIPEFLQTGRRDR
jgi:cell division protein FtsZ